MELFSSEKVKSEKRILIVAAHPDDEILGCGGTVAKLIKQGYEAYTLILGEGVTSRLSHNDKESISEQLELLKQESINANLLLGIKNVFFNDFPDNKFDSISLLSIIKEIEKVKQKVSPRLIFTHHYGDLNVDHQITYKAVITATRPTSDETVKEIYSFEIPSSTEWNSYTRETAFISNVFFDITDSIDIKLNAISCYKSELRDYPHPRSLQHIKELARVNGTKVGLDYCENFILVRAIKNNNIHAFDQV